MPLRARVNPVKQAVLLTLLGWAQVNATPANSPHTAPNTALRVERCALEHHVGPACEAEQPAPVQRVKKKKGQVNGPHFTAYGPAPPKTKKQKAPAPTAEP
jgi:hypothetical protein